MSEVGYPDCDLKAVGMIVWARRKSIRPCVPSYVAYEVGAAGNRPFEALQERGLELSPTKTVITHVEHGFDFLGQNVCRYPNGKLLIRPSQKNVGTFLEGIRTHHQRRTESLLPERQLGRRLLPSYPDGTPGDHFPSRVGIRGICMQIDLISHPRSLPVNPILDAPIIAL